MLPLPVLVAAVVWWCGVLTLIAIVDGGDGGLDVASWCGVIMAVPSSIAIKKVNKMKLFEK